MSTTKEQELELRKKEREVSLCEIVATTINALEGADYWVGGPEHQMAICREPVDVVIESRSGAYPIRQAQVVTIPSDEHLEMRDDNGNMSKLEHRLREILIERKMTGFEVHINLTGDAVLHGMPKQAVNHLADLIQQIRREGSWSMRDPEIWEHFEDVARYVTDVDGIFFSTTSVFVSAGRACFIPSDGRLIEEGIRQKAEGKYSTTDCSCLTLVIGASSAVVQEQIDAYVASSSLSEVPFNEVWIVPRFEGRAIQLNRQWRVMK